MSILSYAVVFGPIVGGIVASVVLDRLGQRMSDSEPRSAKPYSRGARAAEDHLDEHAHDQKRRTARRTVADSSESRTPPFAPASEAHLPYDDEEPSLAQMAVALNLAEYTGRSD